jgi:hypothetical protein
MRDHLRPRGSLPVHQRISCLIRAILRALLCCATLLPAPGLYAAEQTELSLDHWQGEGYAARDISIGLDLSRAEDLSLVLRIGQLDIDGITSIEDLNVGCESFQLSSRAIACHTGAFQLRHRTFGALRGSLTFSWRDGALSFELAGLQFSGGQLDITGNWAAGSGRLTLNSKALALAELQKALAPIGWWPAQVEEPRGLLNINVETQITGQQLSRLDLRLKAEDLGFLGINAAEDLSGLLLLSAHRSGGDWHGSFTLQHQSGTFYVEPGFELAGRRPGFTVTAPELPIELIGQGVWAPLTKQLRLHDLKLRHPDVVNVKASGLLDLSATPDISALTVELDSSDLSGFYKTYLQPVLLGTPLDDLELTGALGAALRLDEQGLQQVSVGLESVYFDDGRQRFRGWDISGDLNAGFDGVVRDSHITWQGGGVHRIDIGPGSLAIRSSNDELQLSEPLNIGILDGELRVETLALQGVGTADFSARMDAVLTPLSLPEFCQAVGWPIMSGSLSGVLPELIYQHDQLRVGGALLMRVFDGEVVIRGLNLTELFGLVPNLNADVELKNLDLELLTRAFSFGNIDGRLGGYIRGLRLENWQPVQFDAAFATPEDDDSRHRISQRAVDNLTSLGGGGATAALSRGFMGVFKEFSYDRIGIGCRLRNGVCTMSGVEQFDNGYAIVTRGLLPPWINVNGFNRTVNWPVLLDRLKAAVGSEGPIVR